MKTSWKALLAGGVALSIAACAPAETEADETAAAETVPEEAAASGDDMMAADAETAAMPEAEVGAADEGTEESEREGHGNPAGPVTAPVGD